MNILQKIIENKKEELNKKFLKNENIHSLQEGKNKSNKNLFKEIFKEKNASLIGEIKIASPKFDYSKQINLEKIFEFYGKNDDIKAVSNLIDKKFFAGDINRGKNFKQKYFKPIFFKEFVIDKRQIDDAEKFGYDAVLLLERVLTEEKIIEFVNYANKKNIFPIVEIDTEIGLENIIPLSNFPPKGERIATKENELDFGIAINCRNLATMKLDRKKHFEIYKKFEKKLEKKLVFAFSGIDDLEQIKEYKGKFNGVLVGSYFMKNFINN